MWKLVRHWNAGVRDIHLKVPLQEGAGGDGPVARLFTSEPTPDEAAEEKELMETVEEWLRGLKGHQRRIAQLWLEGGTDREIAAEVGRTRARVRQIRDDLMQDLAEKLGWVPKVSG